MEIAWSFPNPRVTTVHPGERSVVWKHPGTGEIRYPGRNDMEMPARYLAAGYERHEFRHLHDLDRHGKNTGRMCEIAHYDRNGRGFV